MIVKVTVNHGFVSVSRDPKTGQFVKIGTFNSVPVVKELINNKQSVMFEAKRDAAQRYGAMCYRGALHPMNTLKPTIEVNYVS